MKDKSFNHKVCFFRTFRIARSATETNFNSTLKGMVIIMEWWHWVLIGAGVVLLGWIKLSVFKQIKQGKATKKNFQTKNRNEV